MADQDAPESPEADRLGRVEAKVDRLADAIAKLVGGKAPAGEEPATSPAGRPPTVEEQVAAEFERRDREAQERQAAEAAKTEQEQLREQVRKLSEKPPQPPVRRSTRLLGFGTGER